MHQERSLGVQIQPFVAVWQRLHPNWQASASESVNGEQCSPKGGKTLSIFNIVLLTFERAGFRAGMLRGNEWYTVRVF